MHTQRRYAICPQGMSKKRERKRCIPKEGMPHAPKTCHKKKESRIKENIAHTKENQGREKSCNGVPPPSTKNIHTLAQYWSKFMTCFSFGSVFDLATYEKQVCLHILHTHSSTKKKTLGVGWKRKAHKKVLVRNETLLSDPRDHLRNLQNSFQKLYKTTGLTIEQRSR